MSSTETLVIGHRNPDTDSVAAAFALAELKKLLGEENVSAACAGLPGARTEYLFKRFHTPLPPVRSDVFPRVRSIMTGNAPSIECGESLFHALELLQRHHVPRIPVVDGDKKYRGMLCLYTLLGDMLQAHDSQQDEVGFTGRSVQSSLSLICKVLQGEPISMHRADEEQIFEVYVAAMSAESFKEHIPRKNPQSLAIVVGDRSDVHLMALNVGARLIIVTGSRRVDPVVLQAARDRGMSVIKTPFDSATVVRRLKFSCPVETSMQTNVATYAPDARLSDIRYAVMHEHDDGFPVVDGEDHLLGMFNKIDFENVDSCRLVLVDHNEFDQGIFGIEEVPVVEVIDHHRFGMPPTHAPVKITCDIVGSTCTLIAEMFVGSGKPMTPEIAGILLGGVITDTLLLRSPTATARDAMAVELLKKVAGVEPEALLQDIFKVGSLIARSTPEEVLQADCKSFKHGDGVSFSIAQVEEVSFDEFYAQQDKLLHAAESLRAQGNLNFLGLMVTNVVSENSQLLAVGSPELLSQLPYRRINEHLWDLPGVLSRKKQLLPQILKLLDVQP